MDGLGIAAGLATAALWTATAICFELSSRAIGSFAVNVLRLLVAAALFASLSIWRTGHLMPQGLSATAWTNLALSGLVGFVVADLMLFRAFVLIGARLSMLIYASVPTMTAIAGYVFLNERICARAIIGIALTSSGICLGVAGKQTAFPNAGASLYPGILLAIGASAGQAAGLLFGKRGAGTMDAFSATQVRVVAGLCGFCLLGLAGRRLLPITGLLKTASGLSDAPKPTVKTVRTALLALAIGATLGPFLGVSLGLLSTQLLAAGIASTLMSLVPVLLIPVSALVFRERITPTEIGGSILALGGVPLLV